MLYSTKSSYFIVFLYTFATSITIPFKRDYVIYELHSSSFVSAMLVSLNAFCSFIATPVLGALSDKIGRKPV
jgi:MFS family permease